MGTGSTTHSHPCAAPLTPSHSWPISLGPTRPVVDHMQKISAHSLPISPVGPMNTCPVAYGCKCGRTSSSKDRSLSPLLLTPARTCADSTCSNRTMNPASFVSELAGRVPRSEEHTSELQSRGQLV